MAKKVEELPPAPPLPGAPHTVHTDELVKALGANPVKGFTDAQAQELQNKYGPNQLKPPEKPSPWKLLGRQVANAMTIVLIASMAVSFGTQDWIAGAVILALVVLNVTVGFTQEWKAEKTVAALASVGSPTAVVVRDGNTKTLAVEEVVPGDIILVKNGDVVPADARCLPDELSALETDEALLTGESLPVSKHDRILDEPDCPVGDRKNMVFSGSQVTKGRGRCIVVNTGMRTELGKIAEAMERKETTNHKGWAAKWYKIKVALGTAGTTPLQIKLNTIAYILLGFALLLAFIVVASTAFVDVPFSIATYAVATAVSILPASLIAVVSLTLANATRELAARNALVRRMDAVEALGAVTDICSDKTGTITVGKMVLKKAWIPANGIRPDDADWAPIDTVTGQAYTAESGSDPFYPRGIVRSAARRAVQTSGTSTPDGSSSDDSDDDMDAEDVIRPSQMEEGLKNLVLCASLCNTATIHHSHDDNKWEANGDATEIALQVFAHKLGHGQPHLTHTKKSHAVQTQGEFLSPQTTRTDDKPAAVKPAKVALAGHYAKIVEHPFDSTVKRMSTAWKFVSESEPTDDMLIFMKGAVERILDRCTHVGLNPDNQTPLTDENRAHIIARMDKLAGEGLRVLALSAKLAPVNQEAEIKALPRDELEMGFKFIGLVGIYDPPRPASRSAVLECHKAGITPRMLTGDHPATAAAISRSVGIIDANSPASAVMTGQQFDALTEEQIDALPELPLVVARCAPETKVRMVEAIHRRRRFGMQCTTIMTGDGVNDCPALKRADIGFAMGLNGSDVAKGAAEVVLADDQFGTITRAIKKGRGVLTNLSKFLLFLLSGNIAEVVVLLIGLSFQDPVTGNAVYPLSPVAALFINTIAAGPPALALGLEPTAWDAMFKSPEAYRTIFTRWWWMDLFFYGFLIGGLGITAFAVPVYASPLNGGKGVVNASCNDVGYDSAICENVYHGRATCFSTVMITLMIHSFECKSAEFGMFQMNLLDNKVLLWSASICALATFPILYIPVISDYVFQVVGIGYEWGIVAICVLLYIAITEVYKFIRRKMNPDKIAKRQTDEEKDLARFDTQAEDVFPNAEKILKKNKEKAK